MPEGDTIAYAAKRIRAVLEGQVPEEIRTPHPRHRVDRWPERLRGRTVSEIRTHGKHLFIRFGPLDLGAAGRPASARSAPSRAATGSARVVQPARRDRPDRPDRMSAGGSAADLILHSHLRMTGSWGVYAPGQRWRRSPRRAWLVLTRAGHQVVQFDGPVLELLTESRTRFDQRLAGLGPDVLAQPFDARRYLARLRGDDYSRGIGDALLDQRNVAGIGNLWKSEACWAAAIDPWRPLAELTNAEAVSLIELVQLRMLESARTGNQAAGLRVFRRVGRPCPRCGTRICARGQGDDNRTTFWCPRCQS